MSCKILINFVHPLFEKSVVNHALLQQAQSLPEVTINDLYQEYPDFLFDVEREQQLLKKHDIIVFQHPFYWYSSPSLLKEWQDLVLEAGFAYGSGGYQLEGKKWLSCISVGAPETSYQASEYNHYSIEDLLKPFAQTANFCGMDFLKPFVIFDTLNLTQRQVIEHANTYKVYLSNLESKEFTQ